MNTELSLLVYMYISIISGNKRFLYIYPSYIIHSYLLYRINKYKYACVTPTTAYVQFDNKRLQREHFNFTKHARKTFNDNILFY